MGKAIREGKRERLRTLKDLDAAAMRLSQAGEILLDIAHQDELVRQRIFEQVSPEELQQAIETVQRLTRLPDDDYFQELTDCYQQVRRFVPTLLNTISFESTAAAESILNALHFLKATAAKQSKPDWNAAPLTGLSRSWRRLIEQNHQIDKRAYTVCTLQRMHKALHRHDLFVHPSERWGDVRINLIHGEEWEKARPQVCRALDRSPSAVIELERLNHQLDQAYRRVNANLPDNAAVRIENGTDLIVSNLDKLEEPASLLEARERVDRLMPLVDLPDLVMEIAKITKFTADFTHISEGQARVDNLELSLCAVLVAEACNVGLGAVANAENPALTLDRLAWVQQNYIRASTIASANARLVDAQKQLLLAQLWGGGEVASADGLRFVVPVRALNARPNSRYFGAGRGVTYFNFTSDQFTGFYAILIPGTLRDSLYILEGLLEQQTTLRPLEIMTDTASYSDVVFALFWLLGYQFSPRLADIGDTRFWRLDPNADYGQLNRLAHHQIDPHLIGPNWDDFLRIAGSLKMGTVTASMLMQTLQGGTQASSLSKALAELGRIAKTLYLLAYLDDEAYRRRILTQLNRGEGRHSLARAIFHGQRGELRQRYREGQEDQLGALGLVTNAVVLWNTLYMDAAVKQLRHQGFAISQSDLERLSPLGYAHIHLLGHYSFTLHEFAQRGQLRPLRIPKPSDNFRNAML